MDYGYAHPLYNQPDRFGTFLEVKIVRPLHCGESPNVG